VRIARMEWQTDAENRAVNSCLLGDNGNYDHDDCKFSIINRQAK
jgi:hypothetical protein